MSFYKKLILPGFCLILVALLFIFPIYLVSKNSPPGESNLRSFRAKIIKIKSGASNFEVELSRGEKLELQFPTPLYSFFGRRAFYGISDDQLRRLIDCDSEIYVARINFLWPSRYRVWKIECRWQVIPYKQIEGEYTSSTLKDGRSHAYFMSFAIGFCVLILLYQLKNHE
jgi:hypothetical protein